MGWLDDIGKKVQEGKDFVGGLMHGDWTPLGNAEREKQKAKLSVAPRRRLSVRRGKSK